MSTRRQFKAFADNLCARFVSRNNDLGGYWGIGLLARRLHGASRTEVAFDLLHEATDLDFDSGAWLLTRMVSSGIPDGWLTAATLRVGFTPADVVPTDPLWPPWRQRPAGVSIYHVAATAELSDDHGGVWRGSAITACWDHNPEYERRSGRHSDADA